MPTHSPHVDVSLRWIAFRHTREALISAYEPPSAENDIPIAHLELHVRQELAVWVPLPAETALSLHQTGEPKQVFSLDLDDILTALQLGRGSLGDHEAAIVASSHDIEGPPKLLRNCTRTPQKLQIGTVEIPDECVRVNAHHIPGSPMKRIVAQDELAEGFEPGPLPPIGPDGAVHIPPLKKLPVLELPRLCEAGPCVHYHTFTLQLDAARPIADRVGEGGVLEGDAPAQPFHTQVHHYCYPTVGIETELGALPVLTCNLWEPRDPDGENNRRHAEDRWFATPQGQAYLQKRQAWEDQRQAEHDAAIDAVNEDHDEQGDETP